MRAACNVAVLTCKVVGLTRLDMMQPRRNFWEIYSLYNIRGTNLDGIYLPAMLQQLPKLAPLFFAVAFGSSLDISAIQTESPEPLDYNRQLSTIGKLLSRSLSPSVAMDRGQDGICILGTKEMSLQMVIDTRCAGDTDGVRAAVGFLPDHHGHRPAAGHSPWHRAGCVLFRLVLCPGKRLPCACSRLPDICRCHNDCTCCGVPAPCRLFHPRQPQAGQCGMPHETVIVPFHDGRSGTRYAPLSRVHLSC